MYGTIAISPRSLQEYESVVPPDSLAELKRLAAPLRGLRVLNLSVTAFGTGVADLLGASVPLLWDLGLRCQWQVVRTAEEFSAVNKALYMALGGRHASWSHDMTEVWRRYSAMNADLLTEDFDVVIVHDPQPAAIRSFVDQGRRARARWVMHSHLDISRAQEEVWLLLREHLSGYDAIVFESPAFIRADMGLENTHIIRPAIDPLGPRNMELSEEAVSGILSRYGIDRRRPLICQVSPMDESCDPLGAIDTYYQARQQVPGLQLALVATTVPEDARDRTCFEEAARKSLEYEDVFFLSSLNEVGNVEINVFQRAAAVTMQRDLQRGFGLWLADALWKERPVVAARRGALPEQVIDGRTGFLAENERQFAERMVALLRDRRLAVEMGRAGRQHVADNFLITRYLADTLQLLRRLVRIGA